MIRSFDCKLVLEDGSEYRGYRFGAKADRLCEVVFNTSMVGYQEIVSDPSYTDQAVVMTYPIIGNYGVTDEDYETKIPTIGGLVVREYNDIPSNFRYTKTLSEILEDYGIPGMEGVDTRKLARSIRDHGSRKGLICDIGVSTEEALSRLTAQELPHDHPRSRCRWFQTSGLCRPPAGDCARSGCAGRIRPPLPAARIPPVPRPAPAAAAEPAPRLCNSKPPASAGESSSISDFSAL